MDTKNKLVVTRGKKETAVWGWRGKGYNEITRNHVVQL